MPLILDGLTAIDLTQNVAGPFCAQLLGDFGAAVIKVERPGVGDDGRTFAPEWDGESTAFLAHNRNKKSVAIDLNHPRGLEIVRRLVAKADFFVHSMRIASVESRGLTYEQLSALNPALIYGSISAFGEQGPLRELPGYDPLGQAYSGIMSVTGHPGSPPTRVLVPIIDMGSGLWLFMGLLAAVIERNKTGKGSIVAASLLETGVAWTNLLMTNYMATGKVPEKAGSASPSLAPYEAFETADRPILIAAGNDRLFAKLCEALGLEGLDRDPRFISNSRRTENRAELRRLIEEHTRRRTAGECVELMRKAGVPCSKINSLDEVYADEQVAAVGMLKAAPPGFRIPGFKFMDLAVSINGEKAAVRSMPPRVGEHTDEILRWAGYSAADIASLKAAKATA
jgi:crotonobetainyl-CoA:carnitine CoA-transferase CaiB-like acyl-CoA transferase